MKMPTWLFFLQHHLCTYKTLTSTTNSWLLHFYTSMEHHKLGESNRVYLLKDPAPFLLALCVVSRNYKTRKLLLPPCINRYIFSFTLKTRKLQKLTFYMWNVKKDNGMEENTLHCCYGDYVTTNQQT